MRHSLTAMIAVASVALVSVPAAAVEGIPPGIVGEWDCGASRLVVTRLGSIELMAPGSYRAGLLEMRGGVLAVSWDRGGTAAPDFLRRGETLEVRGLGAPFACRARR